MAQPGADPTGTAAWGAIAGDVERLMEASIAELFAADPSRVDRLSITAPGMVADLSKNLVDAEALEDLLALAEQMGLQERRAAMLAGERINRSEGRSVLHTALRLPPGSPLVVDGVDVAAGAREVLGAMGAFADDLREGRRGGQGGRRIESVVSIGIGGSSLGPEMATKALRRFAAGGPDLRFVANVDAAAIDAALSGLDPASTLVVVTSKTFTTLETMANAATARSWLAAALGDEQALAQMVAVTAAPEAAQAFGIAEEATFAFWDFVGGRFSLASAVGLPLMLAIGPTAFGQMLEGMHAMDRHFASEPLERNLPVLLGLLRVWYAAALGAESACVVPFSADLCRLPAYLQQLEMESNGKGIRLDGRPVSIPSGPIVFGEPGTDAQHSFFQLLHQGTHLVPLDLIGVLSPTGSSEEAHDLLLANLLAQAEALAFGRGAEELAAMGVPADEAAFRAMPGSRPSSLLLLDELSPYCLGALVALYEHETFTQGVLLGVNPFDQFGVELGKELAGKVAAELAGGSADSHDPSTRAAIDRILASKADRS